MQYGIMDARSAHVAPVTRQYILNIASCLLYTSCGISGCIDNFCDFLPDKLDYVRRVDAEDDVQNLGQIRLRLDAFQAIVFLLCSERAFHPRCPHPRQLIAYDVVLFLHEGRTAPAS